MPTYRQQIQRLRVHQKNQTETSTLATGIRTASLTPLTRNSQTGLLQVIDERGNLAQVRSLGINSGGNRTLPGIVTGGEGVGVFFA